MKLHEYQAKAIFARYGIAVPNGSLARTADEAAAATASFGGRAAVKAQVHAGGRGLAGGVKVVSSPDEARSFAAGLLGSRLVTNQTDADGVPVDSVAGGRALADIDREMYVALTIDRDHRGPVVIASAAGGMSIEAGRRREPRRHHHAKPVEPGLGLMPYQCRRVVSPAGLDRFRAARLPRGYSGRASIAFSPTTTAPWWKSTRSSPPATAAISRPGRQNGR